MRKCCFKLQLFFSYSGGIPFIVFLTAGGIPAAPVPTGGNNAFNTVPAQQSLETPILPASNSPGSQIAPRASTFSPQLQSLHISSASSQKSKNIVTSEASILGSSEAITTVDTTEISQQLSLTEPEGDRTDLEGGQQETGNFKSPVQNKEVPKQQVLVLHVSPFPISSKLLLLHHFTISKSAKNRILTKHNSLRF